MGTCSDECQVERRRLTYRGRYHRQVSTIPDYNAARYAARRSRAEADPEYAQRLEAQARASHKRRAERIASDPELRAQVRAYSRELYARHAAVVQQRRRERLDAMSPEERARWLEAARQTWRTYAAKRRAERAADPLAHTEYLSMLAEYRRQRARQRRAQAALSMEDER